MTGWTPLADTHPIPGDPAGVGELASRLRGTGAELADQAGRLDAITSTDIWRGDAAAAFERIRAELPGTLRTVAERYALAGDAVAAYGRDLQSAQDTAVLALTRARDAQAQLASAAAGMEGVRQQFAANVDAADRWNAAPPGEPPRAPTPVLSVNYAGLHSDAEEQLAAARSLLEDARSVRDEAAALAASRVDDAARDELENGVGSWVGHQVRNVGEWVTELPGFDAVTAAAGEVAMKAGVAALVLSWVPIVGQALAVIAVVAGVVSLAGNLAKLAAGTAGWAEVGLDVLGLATLGVGRAATAAARASRAAAGARQAGAAAAAASHAEWLGTAAGRTFRRLDALEFRGPVRSFRRWRLRRALDRTMRGARRDAEGDLIVRAPRRGYVPRAGDLREGFALHRPFGELTASVRGVPGEGLLGGFRNWSRQTRLSFARIRARFANDAPLRGSDEHRAVTFGTTTFGMGAGIATLQASTALAEARARRAARVAHARRAGAEVTPRRRPGPRPVERREAGVVGAT